MKSLILEIHPLEKRRKRRNEVSFFSDSNCRDCISLEKVKDLWIKKHYNKTCQQCLTEKLPWNRKTFLWGAQNEKLGSSLWRIIRWNLKKNFKNIGGSSTNSNLQEFQLREQNQRPLIPNFSFNLKSQMSSWSRKFFLYLSRKMNLNIEITQRQYQFLDFSHYQTFDSRMVKNFSF